VVLAILPFLFSMNFLKYATNDVLAMVFLVGLILLLFLPFMAFSSRFFRSSEVTTSPLSETSLYMAFIWSASLLRWLFIASLSLMEATFFIFCLLKSQL
jgi:hypothetical protein